MKEVKERQEHTKLENLPFENILGQSAQLLVSKIMISEFHIHDNNHKTYHTCPQVSLRKMESHLKQRKFKFKIVDKTHTPTHSTRKLHH